MEENSLKPEEYACHAAENNVCVCVYGHSDHKCSHDRGQLAIAYVMTELVTKQYTPTVQYAASH